MVQMPFIAIQILVERLQWIPWKDYAHRVSEYLLQMKVKGSRRSVEINISIQIQPGIYETAQGRNACLMQGEAPFRKKSIKAESCNIHNIEGESGHVSIPLDIVKIIHGVDA